jgi:hypothetical protein
VRIAWISERRLMPVIVALTVVMLGLVVVEALVVRGIIARQGMLGADLDYYRTIAQRWLDTGVWYTDRQLSGPYETQTLVDNLYPPFALYLFLPWLVLPDVLWWVIPLGFISWTVRRLHPRPWSWPLLALILLLPKTSVLILFGNSDLWVAAAVAAGVLWGWPAILIAFKPSLGFFALIGIHRRSWWVALAIVAVVSIPQLPLWLEWPVAIANSTADATYSLSVIPFIALPIVAWIASSDRPPFGGRGHATLPLR